MNKLQDDLKSRDDRISNLYAQLQSSNVENETVKQKMAKLEQEVARLTQQIRQMENEKSSLKSSESLLNDKISNILKDHAKEISKLESKHKDEIESIKSKHKVCEFFQNFLHLIG